MVIRYDRRHALRDAHGTSTDTQHRRQIRLQLISMAFCGRVSRTRLQLEFGCGRILAHCSGDYLGIGSELLARKFERRTVRGNFYRPEHLIGHEGRLYMFETRLVAGDDYYEEACDYEKTWAGRRLIVLEPNGETHQVVYLPDAGDLHGLCFRGEELFMAVTNQQELYVLRQC